MVIFTLESLQISDFFQNSPNIHIVAKERKDTKNKKDRPDTGIICQIERNQWK
jgi:hypothetical protein